MYFLGLTREVALRRGATRVAGLRLQPGRSRDVVPLGCESWAGADEGRCDSSVVFAILHHGEQCSPGA